MVGGGVWCPERKVKLRCIVLPHLANYRLTGEIKAEAGKYADVSVERLQRRAVIVKNLAKKL